MELIGNKITVNEGYQICRLSDKSLYGRELTLGYSYYINNILQDPPHKDEFGDFYEVSDIDLAKQNLSDDNFDTEVKVDPNTNTPIVTDTNTVISEDSSKETKTNFLSNILADSIQTIEELKKKLENQSKDIEILKQLIEKNTPS